MPPALFISIRITRRKTRRKFLFKFEKGRGSGSQLPGELHERSEWFLPLSCPAGATRGYRIRVLVFTIQE